MVSGMFLKSIPPKEDHSKKAFLFFDGVIFHISYALVKMAQENDVVLVKFPPNVSHFIQPLDKTVFKTMKSCLLYTSVRKEIKVARG